MTSSARAASITAGSGARPRFEQVLDPGYTILPPPQVHEDPLKFRDTKRYTDRLKAARTATGESDALMNARGTIEGHKAVVGVQDFAFMGGSMGVGGRRRLRRRRRGRRSRTIAPTSSSPPPAARGCRKASSR